MKQSSEADYTVVCFSWPSGMEFEINILTHYRVLLHSIPLLTISITTNTQLKRAIFSLSKKKPLLIDSNVTKVQLQMSTTYNEQVFVN